jgi:hypothetical protein
MFFKRDSGSGLIIAAHHPKWSLTWSWILSWNDRGGSRFFWAFRTYKYKRGLYGSIGLGRLYFTRQPTMPLGPSNP